MSEPRHDHENVKRELEREADDDIYTCWCGASGTYDEMFDDSGIDFGCGGLGTVECECGGDMCVCHNHGEIECPGCDDCLEDDLDDYDGDDE